MLNDRVVGLIRTRCELAKNVVKQTTVPQTVKIDEMKVMRDKSVGVGGYLLNLWIDYCG